jgi:PilZ domain
MKRRKGKRKPKRDVKSGLDSKSDQALQPAEQVITTEVPAAAPPEPSLEVFEPEQDSNPRQDPAPAEQVITTEVPTVSSDPSLEVFELQLEFENSASPIETREERAILPTPIVTPAPAREPVPDSAPPKASDRRAHPRYAFNAAVDVAAAEPGPRLTARVRDVSQQGCYVDTSAPLPLGTATHVRITKGAKSFEARARVVFNQPGKGMGLMFTAVEPGHLATLQNWIAESRETSWLAVNRRRSQRVLMKIPVRVTGQIGVALPFEEETHTLAISAHGAMIVVAAPVYRGQRFTLLNAQTKAALECVVVHVERFPEQIQVGVEFLLPNPSFWRVAFPPKDWNPRHPDAKSS